MTNMARLKTGPTKQQKQQYTATVKSIIDSKLAKKNTISKWYVIEEIKNHIHPTEVANASGFPTTDGIENLKKGALVIYRNAMRRLSGSYQVDKEGDIHKRPGK
jgi:hypothetical protein